MSILYKQTDLGTGEKSSKTVEVKSHGWPMAYVIDIGEATISYEDFCDIVTYFLTNVSLQAENDPRLKLIESVKNLQTEEKPCGSILGEPIIGKYLRTKK